MPTTLPARVLIADDEPNILLSLQYLMANEGYDIATARDGEEALAKIEHTKPDVVLLDVMMPRLDGLSVCQRVKASPALKDVRVIMLTARTREAERVKGLSLGADAYITKPFSVKEVLDRVNALVGQRAPI